ATVFTYSLPGLVWFALAIALWLVAELALGRRPLEVDAAWAAISRHRWITVVAVAAVAVVVAVVASPAASFVREIGKVQASSGRLASPVSPGVASRGVCVLCVVGAAVWTFRALRAAPRGFDRRGSELQAIGSRIQDKRVIFFGVDRFAAYWLHGTRVEAPGGYVPPAIEPRKHK